MLSSLLLYDDSTFLLRIELDEALVAPLNLMLFIPLLPIFNWMICKGSSLLFVRLSTTLIYLQYSEEGRVHEFRLSYI